MTKEHFFTKGDMMNRRSSADQTETSFASIVPDRNGVKNVRLRAGRHGPQPGAFQKRSQSLPGIKPADKIKIDIPSEAKVLCFCKQKHLQMPPVVNPIKEDTIQNGNQTAQSPFNMSGFAPSNTHLSRLSAGDQQPPPSTQAVTDSLLKMCEHAKTDNVKIISDILLLQVENLAKTDKNY